MTDELSSFFELHGAPRVVEGPGAMTLAPDEVWLVATGYVDICAVTVDDATARDLERTPLLRVRAGRLLFGLDPHPRAYSFRIEGSGSTGARAWRLSLSALAGAAREPTLRTALAAEVDRWVTACGALCGAGPDDGGVQSLDADATCRLRAGARGQPRSGVLWITPCDGAVHVLDHPHHVIHEGALFPLAPDAWITAHEACAVETWTASSVEMSAAYWQGLRSFHDLLETTIDQQRHRARRAARLRVGARSSEDLAVVEAALEELESVLHRPRARHVAIGGTDAALLDACRLVGAPLGIDVREPEHPSTGDGRSARLDEIARVSRFAYRRVRLREEWFRRDGGPLLGFLKLDQTPVALLPESSRSYRMHRLTDGTVAPVTADLAALLDPDAFSFYRCLPDRPLRGRDLVRFASRGIRADLMTVVVIGALGGLLALTVPVAIGHVFDAVVPQARRMELVQLTLGLLVVAFATAAFQMTRNIALIRLKHRGGDALQAAVWERLMNLPVRFFDRYSAGDLGTRALGIDDIMEQASTSAVATVVSSLFSLLAVGLLVHYSPSIAPIAIGLVFIMVLVTVVTGAVQLRYERRIEAHEGALAGMLLQLVTGVAKLRVAAAENRAYYQWARRYASQNRLEIGSALIDNWRTAFLAFFPVAATTVIFWLVAGADPATPALTTGGFLAFVAAFVMLQSGMLDLSLMCVDLLGLVPTYERLRPILRAAPETDTGRMDPGPLQGRLQVSNLSFRYHRGGPPLLDQVSLRAQPGEFIAIVGPSGGGKTTLLRLLLGFERPDAGFVAYDGHDVSQLDPGRLRRQLGVVLQNGDLLPGDIYTNIVGSALDLTMDDAWEAARLAGVADDIEQMPMGMHTIVTEGAGTLSGGQRQRLLISRALAGKPRLVFFDEATSALDNPTQAMVMQSLRHLRTTRIVIAHRLSTIERADHIYVLEQGRIVQHGSYEDLIAVPGVFRDLAERQIV